MKVVILAAGRGSRMGVLTSDSPKCLTKIGQVSLLSHQLSVLKNAGMREISIVRGYKAEMINPDNVALITNNRWASTNMVSSLLMAESWVGDSDVIVAYSDILYTSKIISELSIATGDLVVGSNNNWLLDWQKRFTNPLEDLETFKVGASGKLLEIGNKPLTLSEIEGQFMGLIKLSYDGWGSFLKFIKSIESDLVDRLDMTSTLNLYIASGGNVDILDIDEPWFEFDSESDLRAYQGTSNAK